MAKKLVDLNTIDRSTPEGREAWSKAFIDNNMLHNWREARIVNKVFKAAKAAGNPVVSVWDSEEDTPVRTLRETQEVVFNLDECFLKFQSGGWARIVLGNEWDALVDYTLSVEDMLAPVNAYIEEMDAQGR